MNRPPESTETGWYVKKRMEWIAETLRIFGFINRAHLQKKFGISTPQAANDFQRFLERYPNKMHYDRNKKCYIRGKPKD